MFAEPALVGREHELEELESFLNSAVEGKGKTVFISGEAGTGKTRLIKEFLNTAKQKQDLSALAGSCLSNAAVPYYPFFEAFTSYFTTERKQENTSTKIRNEEQQIKNWFLGPAQAETLGTRETFAPQVWKDQTFIAVTQTLSNISDEKPLILILDDIHWADSASLALIHHIGRAINSKRILVLATFRSEALTADAQGHPHPLVETLRQMRREDLYKEIKLPNLNQSNVSVIAKSMLGGNLQQELAEKLTKESQGNPLYIVEALRMLREQDSLTQEHDQWRLSVSDLEIPAKIKDIILQRLSKLERNQRRALDAASVIGETFSAQLLAEVLGQDILELTERLESIAQATSLICCGEELYSFDHAKSRESIYEEISPVLRRGYHAKIAEKLEATSKHEKLPFSELTFHYAQAGNEEKAVKYALAAGEDALARWSNQEAIKHFTYVLERVSENGENAEVRRRAREGLGDAYYANSMFKQATKIFEDLSNCETGVTKLRALRKAMESAFQYMDMRHLMELVKKAEPYVAADRLESARILTQRGRAYTFGVPRRIKLAVEDYAVALRVFEEKYSLWDAALAMVGLGSTHAGLGEPQKGIAESLRSIALFENLGDFRFQMEACWAAGINFVQCQLPNEGLGMFAKVIEIDEKTKMGDYQRLVYANAFSAWVYGQMGNWEAALSHSLKALELSKKTDNLIAPAMAYANLSTEYVRLGDLKHAEEYFEKLMALPPEVLLHPFVMGVLAKAVFFEGTGQWKESNQCFKEIFESLKTSPIPGMELVAKLHFAWALERQGRVEEAKVQLEDAQRAMREVEERFAHVSLQAFLMVRREVRVGEEFEMRLDLVNVSKKPGLLVKAEGVIPSEGFKVTPLSPWCSLQNGCIEMKNREIGPFQVETVKLTLQAAKAGAFMLNPKAVYIDEMGETKIVNLNTLTITVQPAQPTIHVVAGRVSSGFYELDDLLGGGIPENYGVVLASSSSDERSLLIKRFLEAGAETGEIAFYITAEAGSGKVLAEKYPSNFYLFLCNPRADAMMQSLPNVVKLKGVENLTEIDIALVKAFRGLSLAAADRKRACIEIVSDVLLQHHAVITRKWLSALLPDLKAQGFTALAVIDPQMHPPEESRAIISLFEGEIAITEKETAKGLEKILRVRKLVNQKYLEDELTLTKEKLSS